MKRPEATTTRATISTSASFVSVPSAFAAAGPGLRNAIKFEFKTILSPGGGHALDLETVFSIDKILVDLIGADADALDARRIAADCDLVKAFVSQHPHAAGKLLKIFQTERPDIDEAFGIVKEAGLTEEAAVRAGGGLIGLIVLLAVVAAAAGCAHTKPHKKPDPNPTK